MTDGHPPIPRPEQPAEAQNPYGPASSGPVQPNPYAPAAPARDPYAPQQVAYPVQQQYSPYTPYPPRPAVPKALSVTSMVCGLAAMVIWVVVLPVASLASVAAVVLGHIGLKREPQARGFAITGIVTGYLGVLCSLLWLLVLIGVFALPLAFSGY